jgi:Spy/CpxP family protein refolding chaperone
MMQKVAWLVLSFLIVPVAGVAQDHRAHPQHAAEPGTEIRALSDDLVRALVAGEGAGYALAAELNRYPGPRHVLDLAVELELTEEQRREVSGIFDAMHEQAVALGARLVEAERELDRLFRERSITRERLNELVSSIAELGGQLRYVHLEAHLRTTRLLTHEQIHRYVQERGYGHGDGGGHGGHGGPGGG